MERLLRMVNKVFDERAIITIDYSVSLDNEVSVKYHFAINYLNIRGDFDTEKEMEVFIKELIDERVGHGNCI